MQFLRTISRLLSILAVSFLCFGCSRKGEPTQAPPGIPESAGVNGAAQAPPASVIRLTYEERQGKNLFVKYCSVCHGMEGKGDGFNSFNLDPKPRNLTDENYMKTLTDVRIAETVRGGGRAVNRSSLMPSWGGRLTSDEIIYVVAYVRSLSTPAATAHK